MHFITNNNIWNEPDSFTKLLESGICTFLSDGKSIFEYIEIQLLA